MSTSFNTDMPARAPRILLVRVGAMGDVLHALPAAAFLRAKLPAAWLGWAIEPRWESLLRADVTAEPGSDAMPLVDRVHAVPTRQWSKRPLSWATVESVLRLRRDLRAERYDVAIDLQGSLRSAIIARMSGARAVVGFAAPRETPARLFYTQRVKTVSAHVIDQGLDLLRAALAGIEQPRPAPPHAESLPKPPLLPRDRVAEQWAAATLDHIHALPHPLDTMPHAAPLVLLAPTAGWGAKEWPADRFGALAAALADDGCNVLLNATPPLPDGAAQAVFEEAVGRLPADRHSRVRIVAATLPQLTALLRRCSLVVAGDTGPLHLAAALGVPVVALFGPTDPARNGPYANAAIVLRDPSSVTDHRRHATTEAGLARIGLDAVLAAARSLLQNKVRK